MSGSACILESCGIGECAHTLPTYGHEGPKRAVALIIPAYNEELVIEGTIQSALTAGFSKDDIYVGSDGSTDATVSIARSLLGTQNVMNFGRSGKAGVIRNVISAFDLQARYKWVHISDADGRFSEDYVDKLIAKLLIAKHNDYAALTTGLKSLRAGEISDFRAYEYGFAMNIIRRYQVPLNLITVIPGVACCLNTDIIDELDFGGGTMTEDFDITLQIHLKKLGKIAFVSDAIVYTQDPKDSKDLYNQLRRWYRGFFQTLSINRIFRQATRVDAYYAYVLIQLVSTIALVVGIGSYSIIERTTLPISVFIIAEIVVSFLYALIVAALSGSWRSLKSFPFLIYYRWVGVYIFAAAFVEVVILKKFPLKKKNNGWGTEGRRYAIAKS